MKKEQEEEERLKREEEEKKKGEKKIILKSKNIFTNRLSRENNPFIKKISSKLNLHNYLIKNFSSSSIKEESKLEEKENEEERNKINVKLGNNLIEENRIEKE